MTNLSHKILDAIKEKKIIPKAKWTFLLKDYAILVASLLSLIIGSLAFAIIIYMVKNNDWDVYEYINDSLLGFIFVTLPYLWLVFLALFILLAYYNFKHTKKGYKFRFHFIIIGSIVISMLFGSVLYAAGVGQKIDEVFAEQIPVFHRFFNQRTQIWNQTEKGLLAGLVISVNDQSLEVIDFNRKPWTVDITETRIAPGTEIIIKRPVRIIGERIDEHNFKAWQISTKRPLNFPKKQRMLKLPFRYDFNEIIFF